jgi:hypothetical protein
MVASLGMLTWSLWPVQGNQELKVIPPGAMIVPDGVAGKQPALLEQRQVELDRPKTLRIGDSAIVSLVFEELNSAVNTPTNSTGYSDVYSSYNLMAEGKLETASLQVDPANPRLESLLAGQTVRFTWQVRAAAEASYPTRVWLVLHFLPLQGGAAIDVPIFIRDLNIQSTSLLGLSGPAARSLGSICIVVGFGLSYDVLIKILKKSQRSPRTPRKTI